MDERQEIHSYERIPLSQRREQQYIKDQVNRPVPNRGERRKAARDLARALNRTRKASE